MFKLTIFMISVLSMLTITFTSNQRFLSADDPRCRVFRSTEVAAGGWSSAEMFSPGTPRWLGGHLQGGCAAGTAPGEGLLLGFLSKSSGFVLLGHLTSCFNICLALLARAVSDTTTVGPQKGLEQVVSWMLCPCLEQQSPRWGWGLRQKPCVPAHLSLSCTPLFHGLSSRREDWTATATLTHLNYVLFFHIKRQLLSVLILIIV